jgi:lipoprotein-anchoring transpeptidase ErfK/SrfK
MSGRHLLVLVAASLICGAAPATAAATAAPSSIVAAARGPQVALFRAPNAKRAFLVLRNPIGNGGPLVFLVRRRIAGWVQVRLALRPNGTLGWIRAAAVSLALDPYKISVSLDRHRLTVRRSGRVILATPSAVGRSSLPTPTGVYYVTELLQQPNPNGTYGPYAFGLSAFSNALFSFGGGPGQIGLHGTNEPGLLGTSASHGCIRVSNSVIARLARILPLGTPVVIAR